MKRICSLVLASLLLIGAVLSFGACKARGSGTYRIGVLQLAQHDALDAATRGFTDALKAELGEENVTIDIQNAAGDNNTCNTIANTFVNKNYDLILANATAALQAAAGATMQIPILGTSVTDYATALKLENFGGTVGGNISGTSDLAPLDQQAQMILDLVPNPNRVGIIYCSAEANSKFQVDTVKAELLRKGLTEDRIKLYPFSDSNDISSVVKGASAACDVLYVPTDNTAANATETIYEAMSPKRPLIAGEESTCKGCGIATLTISYYDLGYETGKMAVRILRGEAKIADMPIAFAPNFTKKYNARICAELGITPPAGYEMIAGTERS